MQLVNIENFFIFKSLIAFSSTYVMNLIEKNRAWKLIWDEAFHPIPGRQIFCYLWRNISEGKVISFKPCMSFNCFTVTYFLSLHKILRLKHVFNIYIFHVLSAGTCANLLLSLFWEGQPGFVTTLCQVTPMHNRLFEFLKLSIRRNAILNVQY